MHVSAARWFLIFRGIESKTLLFCKVVHSLVGLVSLSLTVVRTFVGFFSHGCVASFCWFEPYALFVTAKFVFPLFVMPAKFIEFTPEEMANAPPLEPGLEGLLRSQNLHEEVIMAFRVNEVLSRSVFVALDTTIEGLSKTAETFGINVASGEFVHKREMAKLISAWQQGKVDQDTKQKVDAVCKAHGEPVAMLPEEYESLLVSFAKIHGKFHDAKLPAQSYFEAFQDKLQEGRIKPESLPQVVSLAEEEAFEATKPESKSFAIHLDSSLTVQSKKRYIAKIPSCIEELRSKYTIMSNMWLLSKLRSPGRPLFSDLDEHTWSKFLETLLSEDNFLCERRIHGGKKVLAPDWNSCLEYEFQLRKQACKIIREFQKPIATALREAYEDPQHRMSHWISLLSLSNGREQPEASELAVLKKRLAAYERASSKPQKAMKGAHSYDAGTSSYPEGGKRVQRSVERQGKASERNKRRKRRQERQEK